jgi:hypothetical protein
LARKPERRSRIAWHGEFGDIRSARDIGGASMGGGEGLHERFDREDEIKSSSDRAFGLLMAAQSGYRVFAPKSGQNDPDLLLR